VPARRRRHVQSAYAITEWIHERQLREGERLNRFVGELAKICRERLMEEKWLISPSLRVGHQWLDSLTFSRASVLNIRVKTLKGMALDAAAPEMSISGVGLISDAGSVVLVDRIIQELRKDPSRYFSSLPQSSALPQAMFRAVRALQMAGLEPDRVRPELFEVTDKGTEVLSVLSDYLRELKKLDLIDYPQALEIAIRTLPAALAARSTGALVLVPGDIEAIGLEKAMIEAIPDSNRLTVPIDNVPDGMFQLVQQSTTDAELLKWILTPAEAPAACRDGTAEMFTAVGECNEVREVLRRCLARGYWLDEVELLHTDATTYIPLIYETLGRVLQGPSWDDATLPVTFAEGIPTRYSRPGRALKAWIEWMTTGFPQTVPSRMLMEGLLELPESAEELHSARLSALLRETPIGFGRDRYGRKLNEKVADLEGRISSHRADPSDESVKPASSLRSLQELLNEARAELHFIESLLTITPESGASDVEILHAAEDFLGNFARSKNEMDNYAMQALLDRIREMSHWIGLDPEPLSLDIVQWLARLPDEVRVGGSGPRPGHLHVAHVLTGGHSDRKHTFVIGLDDGRFPGAGLNDPLLLDSEKERLSEEIPKASAQPRVQMVKLARLMARLRGTVTLSFSSLNLEDDRATFPSPAVFSAYRILSNEREGGPGDMMRWLRAPASFAPDRERGCLDETEWWLTALCGKDVPNAIAAVSLRFPHLARGLEATALREGSDFTAYDGFVPNPPPELDPFSASGPIMSSTRLETIGRCPLAYYFKSVLGLEPLQEFGVDTERWLDPLQFGELLHSVFYDFMALLLETGERPKFSRHCDTLHGILQSRIEQYADMLPPAGVSAFRRQRHLLAQAAHVFLVEEEILCQNSQPRFLEVSVGLPRYERGSDLDQPDPVHLRLPEGRTIRSRARIDRIDEVSGGDSPIFCIWDYKTGGSDKYQTPDPLRQGRSVQHALYTEIGEAILKKKVSRNASLAYFGYFFPGYRTRGSRILRQLDNGDEALRVVADLCKIVADGCFIATDNHREDCAFCDYLMICGDVESVAAASRRKLESPKNIVLNAFRELRDRGNG
jgi:RecB family exonuclease